MKFSTAIILVCALFAMTQAKSLSDEQQGSLIVKLAKTAYRSLYSHMNSLCKEDEDVLQVKNVSRTCACFDVYNTVIDAVSSDEEVGRALMQSNDKRGAKEWFQNLFNKVYDFLKRALGYAKDSCEKSALVQGYAPLKKICTCAFG